MDYCINDKQDLSPVDCPIDEDEFFFLGEQGVAITSSSTIASILGVEHPEVMRAITTIRNTNRTARAGYFRASEDWTGELCYSDAVQIQPVFDVTVEGFSLIAAHFYMDQQMYHASQNFLEKFKKTNTRLRWQEI